MVVSVQLLLLDNPLEVHLAGDVRVELKDARERLVGDDANEQVAERLKLLVVAADPVERDLLEWRLESTLLGLES